MRKVLSNYVSDIIYGANDGVITTFAIVAGAVGASLNSRVILILGFAGLFADAFSMGASNYLGNKSEKELAEANSKKYADSTIIPAVLTFFSFILAGTLPLLPYIFLSGGNFFVAFLATGATLFLIGALLGYFVLHRHWFLWGLEMLVIGGVAALIAFGIGNFVGQFIGA